MNKNYIRVLGSADWHPTGNNDHSCYTIDDKILIDACPSLIPTLLGHGVDPVDIPYVCFTHMHCDHCMGLAPLLHYWRVCKNKDLSGLTIIGPKATLREAFARAMHFVFGDHPEQQLSEMPRLIELEGDAQLDILGYHIRVMNSDHVVPGLCYRITDTESGHSIGLTGDTAYLPAFPTFFAGVDMLAHEASYGEISAETLANTPRHSGAPEAVRVCNEAQVKSLLLTHTYEPKRAGAMKVVTEQLNIPVKWAMPYNVFQF